VRDAWWRVGGWAIHGWEAGSGPAVVLVHGLGVSGRYLLPTARALAARDRRVLVPDLPGFGLSMRPPRPLRLEEQSALLERLAGAVGVERATFLGNSFGCQVVTHLAAARPELVERLILVGPTVDASARNAVRQAWRLLLDARREPPELVRLVASDYLRAGPVTVAATAAEALRDRIEDTARRVEAPTLVVRGSRDPLVPHRWAERLAAAFPAGSLHVVEGAPHAVNYVAPEALADLVSAGSPQAHG
jgi:2-hydroxy-6-oxonona-2,4-dienedioate hydrolase